MEVGESKKVHHPTCKEAKEAHMKATRTNMVDSDICGREALQLRLCT